MKKPLTTKRKKKRILPVAKRGGILPFLPLLVVVSFLAGCAARIAKAVNDSKTTQRQLEEIQRHNRAMEDRGLYLFPYKRGQGFSTKSKKKKCRKKLKMPTGATTNVQLEQLAKRMCIPFFKGVFMRNNLPISDVLVRPNESGIVNLNDVDGPGTYWVAYAKRGDRVVYFGSFGYLRPPKELVRYLGRVKIEYNYTFYQNYNQSICGQLCLRLSIRSTCH